MNILLVVSSMNAEAGGVTTIVAGVSDALTRRGHNVRVATVDHGGTPVDPSLAAITRFAPGKDRGGVGPSHDLDAFLAGHIHEYEVVHVHGIWQRPGHYVARRARAAGVPYVVSTHGMLDRSSLKMGRTWAKRLAWQLWDGPMIKRAAAVQCSNDAEYWVSPWLLGRPVAVVGNGVPAAVLADMPARGRWRERNIGALARADRPVALFLSRIHPKKGLERMLPCWAELLAKQPDVLLVVAGSGSAADENNVRGIVRKAGLEQKVFFSGQLVGREKWEALVDADVFVLPTYQEAFSLAVTEAMAASCPVITTREANFDEVATSGAGMVIGGGDMAKFVSGVGQLLGDPGLRRAMGGNGRKLVESRFTWEAIAERLEKVYGAVCRREPIPTELQPARG